MRGFYERAADLVGRIVPASRHEPSNHDSLESAESEAERLFLAAMLEGDAERAPDIEQLCDRHPRHASELRRLHASWKRGRAALGSPRPAGSASRYRLLGEIAEGGMGAIFLVWDASLGRPLAMKVLKRGDPHRTDGAARERARLRLRHEARILGRLQHPSIVPVHEVGELEDGEPYFTMLEVRGLVLSEILPRIASGTDGWTLPRAIRVLLQVCEAVAHAHSQGIVHRDLKPANVMVGPFGETYVMDWGLAKARDFPGEADVRVRDVRAHPGEVSAASDPDPGAARAGHATPLLTLEGDVLGTPAYMAPEQARGRLDEVGPRSDVYSAGAILYHLLAGVAPYDAGRGDTKPREVLERVLAGPPASLAWRAPRAPAELIAIAEKAMARDARERYATMQELAGDLRAWLEVRVVRAHASGAWAELVKWVQRHTVVVGLLAALLVLLVGSAVTFGLLYRKAEERRRQADIAQADSLRRQNALRPLAPWSANLPSFRDDFEDGFLDRRWIATGRTDLVHERAGRLRLESSADGEMDTSVILDPYVNVIRGDFDACVDFSLEHFAVDPFGLLDASFSVDKAIDGTLLLAIARRVTVNGPDPGPNVHSYCAYAPDRQEESVAGDDLLGRFRLTRVGKRITAFYWHDGWQELLSKDCTSDPVRLRFNARGWPVRDPVPFAVEFDDFEVETRFEMPSKTLRDFRDEFSDQAIDSRLIIRADAGLAAELDGRLYLDKFQGRKGSVAVELGAWNWVLRGDLSVSFDFELLDFPFSGDEHTSLSLSLLPLQESSLRCEVLATSSGRSYRLLRYAGESRRPFDSSKGRLRMERRGARVFFQFWDDGWQDLGMGFIPLVDCTFKIQLESSLDEAVVVAIDNLEVTSMIRRTEVGQENTPAEQVAVRRIDGPSAGAGLAPVSAVGDVDRDGVSDFAVAACGNTEAGKLAGSVWIHSGRDFSVLSRFQGREFETFGNGLAGAGDVDADGYPDVVVGAPSMLSTPVPEYATVFSGRHIADGSEPSELYTWSIGSTGDEYGLDVAGLGDVDGDGHDDVFVGARERDEGRGTAFVYSGRDGSELFRIEGEEEKSGMGSDAVGLGDLDGDGCDDFAVGAVRAGSRGKTHAGRVFVLLGGPAGRIGRHLHPPLEGDRKADWFGASVARAGDVDGDGLADLVVGASGQAEDGASPGYVRMFSGRDGTALWTARGDSVGDYFGREVAGAGDVNGDGVPDVLVAARFDCNRGRRSGMVEVLSGRDGAVLADFDGGAEGDSLGASSGLGDVDGDGLADFLVSAPGADPGGLLDAGSLYLIPGKSCTGARKD
jgi:serine/threonine protein kinase